MLDFINAKIFGPGLCAAVFLCGICLFIKLRPFFLTKPRRMLAALRSDAGKTSPMRAMLVALAGTLGVGNIAGVASAIAIGGAGAVFWMWVSALAALPVKYAEIVLAVRHRRSMDGKWHGGAFFYIADRGGRLAHAFAMLFAMLCLAASFFMGCAVQANAIAVSLEDTFGVHPLVCGSLLAIFVLTVISGGLSRISALTMRLIPLMSGIYILMCAWILFANLPMLGEITREIVVSAFTPDAAVGGFFGVLTSRALRMGVTRGIVSNEAGCGTAPIAHASAEVISPAAQGVWGILEVFIDTVVICSLTAYTVLIAKRYGIFPDTDGMASALRALDAFIPHAEVLLCAAVLIFAFCTVICWFHYGTESLAFLTKHPLARRVYMLLYAAAALFGCMMAGDVVWSLSDLLISVMSALNIVAVLLSADEVKHETDNYFYAGAYNFVNTSMPNLHSPVAKSDKL